MYIAGASFEFKVYDGKPDRSEAIVFYNTKDPLNSDNKGRRKLLNSVLDLPDEDERWNCYKLNALLNVGNKVAVLQEHLMTFVNDLPPGGFRGIRLVPHQKSLCACNAVAC